ncbi:uncharacterized protein ARMOST_15536 [Armillaria ostoyae]|uniref:Uncharacterized protein n=1 Tax=Armillaria ostoyae TaxID=47428 RepID=A0A284RTR7_ARMOS|nr:uncharacterized protein ARMOST_15536 [Armillaria ostoyae]
MSRVGVKTMCSVGPTRARKARTWWFSKSDKRPWLKPPSTYSPMKVRHGEETRSPLDPVLFKDCGAYSQMRRLRLLGGGSHGEAETAYDGYGMLCAIERPTPARRREEGGRSE